MSEEKAIAEKTAEALHQLKVSHKRAAAHHRRESRRVAEAIRKLREECEARGIKLEIQSGGDKTHG